jgi:protein TonB
MDTRYTAKTRWHARGAVRPVVIAIVGILALLAIGAWLLIIRPRQQLLLEDATGRPPVPASSARQTVPPPANVAGMGIDQLLDEARKAMNEQRYLAPAGNNAFEFYLRVLEKQPGNQVASDALRETFPFAASSAEQAVNSRDFGEAQRQIDLLAKADPANFTLTILRSKLDAQRKLMDKQQQQALDEQKAQQLAAQKAAADRQAEQRLAAEQKKATAEQPKAQPTRTQLGPAMAGQAPRSESSPVAAASNQQSTDAVLVSAATARFPTAAVRARQEGWVLVSFTIEPNGRTSNIKVVDSQPHRVFDRAAMDAVGRYRFTPAMKGGVAVSSVKQQRIEFKL